MRNEEWLTFCREVRRGKAIVYCGPDGELIIRKFEPERADPYGYEIVGVYNHRKRLVVEEDIAACHVT